MERHYATVTLCIRLKNDSFISLQSEFDFVVVMAFYPPPPAEVRHPLHRLRIQYLDVKNSVKFMNF